MTPVTGCPVLQDTRQIQGLAHDLTKTMRKLRRDLEACEKCPAIDDCQVLKEYRGLVQEAINSFMSEWDYTQEN
jgi:hypothetical protein